jgi:hypothetical protein
MKNYYYLFWADAILSFKKYNPKRKDWIPTLLFMNSFLFSINLWIILIWLKYFNIFEITLIDFHVSPISTFNDFFSYFVIFILPFLTINYFLIFFNSRYKKITEKYNQNKIRYALYYSMSILSIAIITIFFLTILS